MTMTKREIAIISVATTLEEWTMLKDVEEVATSIVNQLIADGVIPLGYAGDPDVSELVDQFQMAFRTTATNKMDRFAASRLAKRHGAATVVYVMQQLAKRRNEKYAPTVNNLVDLERKWPSVERFIGNGGEGNDL